MTPIIQAVPGSEEDYYTKLHMTARNTVERCIGLLKARWRCLLNHRVLHYDPIMAGNIVNACVILHNIAIDGRAPIPEPLPEPENENLHLIQGREQEVGLHNRVLAEGRLVRAALVQRLWRERIV